MQIYNKIWNKNKQSVNEGSCVCRNASLLYTWSQIKIVAKLFFIEEEIQSIVLKQFFILKLCVNWILIANNLCESI